MKANNVFSVLYRTRVKVQKDDTPILNLSLIFSIIAVCYRADDTVSDQVATNDTAEDVNQNGFHFVVREDDFERFGYTFFGCAAANVKGAVNSFTGTENESEEKKDEEE